MKAAVTWVETEDGWHCSWIRMRATITECRDGWLLEVRPVGGQVPVLGTRFSTLDGAKAFAEALLHDEDALHG